MYPEGFFRLLSHTILWCLHRSDNGHWHRGSIRRHQQGRSQDKELVTKSLYSLSFMIYEETPGSNEKRVTLRSIAKEGLIYYFFPTMITASASFDAASVA